jgi:hypothetical protein
LRLAPHNPAGVGEWGARHRAPATLVDAVLSAVADVGSIPTVSTSGSKPNSTSDVRHIARVTEPGLLCSPCPSNRVTRDTLDR